MAEHARSSWESNRRPVFWSTKVMASSVKTAVGALMSVWLTVAGCFESSNSIRVSWPPAPNKTALVLGFTPIDGSPPLTGRAPSVAVLGVDVAGLGGWGFGLGFASEIAGSESEAASRDASSSHRVEKAMWR